MPNPDLGPLQALNRLRHAETDAARRDLGEAVAREAALSARQSTLDQECGAARQISGEFDREAFAAWFARMRAEQKQLASAIREAASRTEAARITLAHRRVAETAAETVLADAVTALRLAAERREQVMLEDVARALKRLAG